MHFRPVVTLVAAQTAQKVDLIRWSVEWDLIVAIEIGLIGGHLLTIPDKVLGSLE